MWVYVLRTLINVVRASDENQSTNPTEIAFTHRKGSNGIRPFFPFGAHHRSTRIRSVFPSPTFLFPPTCLPPPLPFSSFLTWTETSETIGIDDAIRVTPHRPNSKSFPRIQILFKSLRFSMNYYYRNHQITTTLTTNSNNNRIKI